MLIPKDCPPSCKLAKEDNFRGFIPPSGTGSKGIMVFGEAGGIQEKFAGRPFVEHAPAGSTFERVIKMCRMSREELRIANIVNCQPPRDYLAGAPWELNAINSCSYHRNRFVAEAKPRAILALGGIALRTLTGLAGKYRGVGYLRGYVLPAHDYFDNSGKALPVIASFHPSHLRRGKMELMNVLAYDLRKVEALAAGTLNGYLWNPHEQMPKYMQRPSQDESEAYYIRARDNANLLVAYDIETQYSLGEDEEELEAHGEITQVQFSLAPGEGIALDPRYPMHFDLIRRMLALPNPKAGHNAWRFDNPILARAGVPVAGRCDDTMWMWHSLQPDLPANLQFVASFYGMPFPWKHYSQSNEQFYGIADVDAVQRIMAKLPEQMRSQGVDWSYERHKVGMEPILVPMSARGVPVDNDKRVALGEVLAQERDEIAATIQPLIPESLFQVSPKTGYKREPKDTTGMVQREFQLASDDAQENMWEEIDPTKVIRWCKVLPFNPHGSSHDTLNYLRHMAKLKPTKYWVPKSLREEKETSGQAELERVYAKSDDPVLRKILDWRERATMINNFVEAWTPDASGYVHPQYYYRTAIGQLNSRNPNGQNFPHHTKIAREMRKMIAAKPGHKIVELDFKSFHAITLGFEAQDADYIRLARLDIHSFVTAHFLHLAGAEGLITMSTDELQDRLAFVKSHHRAVRDSKAKHAILGIGNGLGARKLYHTYQEYFESEAEARKLLDLLHGLFPKVFAYHARVKQIAHEQTYLLSRYKYKRSFFDVYYNKWNKYRNEWQVVAGDDAEAAISYFHSNDAFGHLKDCLLRFHEKGWDEKWGLMNTIHDQLMFHCPDQYVDECLHLGTAEMQLPNPILVDPVVAPLGLSVEVEAGVGQSWDAMEKICTGSQLVNS